MTGIADVPGSYMAPGHPIRESLASTATVLDRAEQLRFRHRNSDLAEVARQLFVNACVARRIAEQRMTAAGRAWSKTHPVGPPKIHATTNQGENQ